MAADTESLTEAVRGLISPAQWDDEENIVAVLIRTANDEEYVVEAKGQGPQLLKLIDRYVEAAGRVRRRGERASILVTKFSEIAQPEGSPP
jgi:hypothetical protein